MAISAPYDARQVSNYLIKLALESGQSLTQMTLLKIIFYAHGWYLASYGTALIKQPVEAWEYGPVVKVVRDSFKEFEKNPITKFAEKLNLMTGELVILSSSLEHDDAEFVKSIYKTYSRFTAFELSDMTHKAGSPWDKVWNTKASVGRIGLRIKNDEIRDYFLKIQSRALTH